MQLQENVMMQYIEEIPKKLSKMLCSKQVDEFIEAINEEIYENILIIGSGSSYNAGIISKKLFEKYAEIKTSVLYPSIANTTNIKLYDPTKTLIIGISQTGTSTSTIEAVNIFKEKDFKILTITNQLNSPLNKLGTYQFDLLSGEEDSNAKTKGFMNTVLILQLLAMKLARQDNGHMSTLYNQFVMEVEESINEIPHTIRQAKNWVSKNINQAMLNPSLVVATEEYLGVAMEGSTKLLETTGSLSSPIDYTEFSHGMHRTVDQSENLYIVLGETKRESIIKSINYLENKTSSLCVLNIIDDNKIYNDKYFININKQPIINSVYNLIVVFQVFSSLIPYLNKLDPNRDLNDDYASIVSTRINSID